MKRRPGTRSKMACVLACAAWALCMQGAEAETATWIASQKGTVSWETAAYWEAGVVPAITNSLDLSATNLVVTLTGDPQGLQVIDNPWTQEDGGDKVVLALNALVGGPKTEFDIWYANFCRPLLIRDPSRYLGAWAIPSAWQHGAGSVMQLLSDAAWTSTVNRVKLSGRMGFRVPTGATAALEYPFGEGLFEVNRQYNGRRHVNTATAGTLDIRNSPGGESYLSLHDGAVTLHGRPGGDAPALVPGAAVHLDASAPDAFELDGEGKVRTWRAMPGTAVSAAAVSALSGFEAVAAPTVVTDAATGKPVVDFGAYAANAAAQQGTSAALGLSETLRNVRELFIVFRDKSPKGIRPQFVGYSLREDERLFFRQTEGALFDQQNSDNNAAMPVRAGEIRVDDQAEPFEMQGDFSRRLHVVSVGVNTNLTAAGDNPVAYLAMAGRADRFGGIQIAEILLYTNALTSAERRQNNAALLGKWRPAAEARVWDYGELRFLSAAPEVTVAEGTVAVREITLTNTTTRLVKKGAGTLLVGRLSRPGLVIEVQEGNVRFVDTVVRGDDPQPAADPFCWFDATAAASLVPDGATGIAQWRDRRDGTNHYGKALHLAPPTATTTLAGGTAVKHPNPTLNTAAADGRALVDLGDVCVADTQKAETLGASTSLRLYIDGSVSDSGTPNTREGYVVYYKTDETSCPVASSSYNLFNLRNSSKDLFAHPFYCHTHVIGGYWRYDGLAIDPTACANTCGEVHIVSFRFASKRAIDAFCTDRGSIQYQIGGAKIGEVLYYDRLLTDQERRDTEAYLFRKWKGTATPQDAMAAEPQPSLALPATGADTELGTDTPYSPEFISGLLGPRLRFTGSGTFVCTNALTARTREIMLAGGGALDLTLDFDFFSNAWFHVDATHRAALDYLSATTNAVARWEDIRANGLAATPFLRGTKARPFVVQTEVNDTGLVRPVMDFGEWYNGDSPTNTASSMEWSARTALQEFYLVQRDKGLHKGIPPENATEEQKRDYGYPCLFGQLKQNISWEGDDYYVAGSDQIAFFRNSEALLVDWAQPNIVAGYIGVNGEQKDRTFAPVTNTFYVYSFQLKAPDHHVQTFARRDNFQVGGQQVAEMICFAETNTAARRVEIENYLMKKWFGTGGAALTWPMERIAFADASSALTLRLDDCQKMSLAALDCVFDGARVGCLTLAGTLVFPEAGVLGVDVTAPRGAVGYGVYPLVRATTIEGFEHVAHWPRAVTFANGATCSISVRASATGVDLVVAPRSTVMILR